MREAYPLISAHPRAGEGPGVLDGTSANPIMLRLMTLPLDAPIQKNLGPRIREDEQ